MLLAISEKNPNGQDPIIEGWLPSADCWATLYCLRNLGVSIGTSGRVYQGTEETPWVRLRITGVGLRGLATPTSPLDCGNSGTTMRLLAGILAGQGFGTTLTGDESLSARPMDRIIEPLTSMGARISGREGRFAPLSIQGGSLKAVKYELPVASAQVKSSILLAGLYAAGRTTVVEPIPTRDHTERMLGHLGVQVERQGADVSVEGGQQPQARDIAVPGDLSSAAFPMGAALLVAGSSIQIEGVSVNPTRSGILEVLERMGAEVNRSGEADQSGEPVANLAIESANLVGAGRIDGDIIPRLIDEIPIIAVLASQAQGITEIRGAAELRVKETDRIATLTTELRKMGADVKALEDGMVIAGPTRLRGAEVSSHGDHRIAMALAVAALTAEGETLITRAESTYVSYPWFDRQLTGLGANLKYEEAD